MLLSFRGSIWYIRRSDKLRDRSANRISEGGNYV